MKKVLLTLFVFSAIVLAACGSTTNSSASVTDADTVPTNWAGKTNPLGPGAAAAGAEIFKTNCVACHGSAGHGDGPASTALDPRPSNLAVLQSQVADDYLFWRISTGVPGTSMVSWQDALTQEQIWQLVTFLHTLKP